MSEDKYYEIKVGDDTYKVKIPKFITKSVDSIKSLTTPAAERSPVSLGKDYGHQPSREFKNVQERDQFRQLDEEMRNVGRPAVDQQMFPDDMDRE